MRVSDNHPDPFLQRCFEEFYGDLSRVKNAIVGDPWGLGAKEGTDAERAQWRAAAAQDVCARLQAILEKQAAEAGRQGGEHGANTYRDAQYVMAALADEVFLHLDWVGRGAWATNLLEARLFGTHVAGERFFQQLDRILGERDVTRRGTAAMYLLALSLGFQGRYRGRPDAAVLESYRERLYDFVFPRQPSVTREERRLFPQAYLHTLDDPSGPRLPSLRRWAVALAVVTLFYVAVSHAVWARTTSDLRALAAQITESPAGLGLDP